jgi:hypothetical protein
MKTARGEGHEQQRLEIVEFEGLAPWVSECGRVPTQAVTE